MLRAAQVIFSATPKATHVIETTQRGRDGSAVFVTRPRAKT